MELELKLSSILTTLMKEEELSESELARRSGVGQPVINRIKSENTSDPKLKTLRQLANYFDISISQLIGDEPLPKDRLKRIYDPKKHAWSKVPLLTWEQIPDWSHVPKQAPVVQRISTDVEVSENAYAVIVKDTTMLPRFPEGTVLIIDSSHQPQDKDFAMVQLEGQRMPTFKQVLIDGDDMYLKPMNADFNTILVDAKPRFLGTMVQARMDFKKPAEPAIEIRTVTTRRSRVAKAERLEAVE